MSTTACRSRGIPIRRRIPTAPRAIRTGSCPAIARTPPGVRWSRAGCGKTSCSRCADRGCPAARQECGGRADQSSHQHPRDEQCRRAGVLSRRWPGDRGPDGGCASCRAAGGGYSAALGTFAALGRMGVLSLADPPARRQVPPRHGRVRYRLTSRPLRPLTAPCLLHGAVFSAHSIYSVEYIDTSTSGDSPCPARRRIAPRSAPHGNSRSRARSTRSGRCRATRAPAGHGCRRRVPAPARQRRALHPDVLGGAC